jgi:hypothetical protein
MENQPAGRHQIMTLSRYVRWADGLLTVAGVGRAGVRSTEIGEIR